MFAGPTSSTSYAHEHEEDYDWGRGCCVTPGLRGQGGVERVERIVFKCVRCGKKSTDVVFLQRGDVAITKMRFSISLFI